MCRAYDLSDEAEKAAWLEDARQTAAEAIIRRAVSENQVLPAPSSSSPNNRGDPDWPRGVRPPSVDLAALRLALRVCVARLAQDSFLKCADVEDDTVGLLLDTQSGTATTPVHPDLSTTEWATLVNHPCLRMPPPEADCPELEEAWFKRRFITRMHKGGARLGQASPSSSNEVMAESPLSEGSCASDDVIPLAGALRRSSSDQSSHSAQTDIAPDDEPDAMCGAGVDASGFLSPSRPVSPSHSLDELPMINRTDADIQTLDCAAALVLARDVMAALSAWHVQTQTNGMNNLWIAKPAGKSRGRGIRLFNDPVKLMSYIRGEVE